jgi:radical SAM enzyme (TIGR01210 family)
MCDLWRFTIRDDTPAGAIPAQVEAALRAWRDRGEHISRLKLYNASNFFDPRAVPERDYVAIGAQLGGLEQVIVESHPSLIGPRVDRFLEALGSTRLEVAMGLETAHPAALEALNKRMTLDDFAQAADDLRRRNVSVRVFVLIGPPFVPAAEQDTWLLKSVAFAEACGAAVVSLIPARAGNGTMEALTAQKLFQPPTPEDIKRSLKLVLQRSPSPKSPAPRILLDPWAHAN